MSAGLEAHGVRLVPSLPWDHVSSHNKIGPDRMVRIEIIWGHTVQWKYLGTPIVQWRLEIFGDTLYSVDIHIAYNSISNSYLN